jgi:hypothetical protein
MLSHCHKDKGWPACDWPALLQQHSHLAPTLGSAHILYNWPPDLATRLARKTAVANLFSPFGHHFATVAKKCLMAIAAAGS